MDFVFTAGAGAPAIQTRQRLNGTPQQEAFWGELRRGTCNILLEARAGTGKSTSCREGMHLLLEDDPNLSIRYCCFNKKIADEFRVKAPAGCEVGTMHAFGLRALQRVSSAQIEADKSYMILDQLGWENLKKYWRRASVKLASAAKNRGLFPPKEGDPFSLGDLYPYLFELIDHFEIDCFGEEEWMVDLATRILERSAEMTSIADFDDMLWLPVHHRLTFPSVDFLFIDECQDLNPLQHELAELMSGSGRSVVVGDPYQSIYAFRGADSQSIPKLRRKLDAKVMPLTVSFRCPRLHVEEARNYVHDFECLNDAPDGILLFRDIKNFGCSEPGDLVLCRTNAPLIEECLHCIGAGIPAIVRGRAIGDNLMSIVRKLRDPLTITDFSRQLQAWKAREIERLEAKDGTDDLIYAVHDKVGALDSIAMSCANPSEIPGRIDSLFSDKDSSRVVTFSSIHRAKGSEAKNVRLLRVPYGKAKADREPKDWEIEQRRNLAYVSVTRSLHSMTIYS